MPTPLTLYGTHTAATTITTANTLVTSTGGAADLTKTTLVGTATGYGTLRSQGNAGAWPAAGSLPAFNGFGWLWDVTTLEGNTLVGGNFTPSFKLNTSIGSIVGDLYCRAAKVNGGVYTQIGGNFVKTNNVLITTAGTYTLPVVSLPTTIFNTGDKLYIQLDLNITTPDANAAATIIVSMSNSSTLGLANAVQLITAGYTTGGGGGGGGGSTVGSFGVVANGTGVASFDHFRAVTYPDPALSLGNMGRIGSSFVGYNSVLPSTATTLGIDVSTDGVNFTDMSLQSGGTIPGINAQLDPYQDLFNVDSSLSYTDTMQSGSTVPATWWMDIANSRLQATGGTNSLFLYGPLVRADVDLFCDMDRSDVGGLVWRVVDTSDFYKLVIADSAATVSTANRATLYSVVAGVETQLAQAIITFLRGTYHRFRVKMLSGVITATMDGNALLTYTDPAPLAAGQVGLFANAGGAASMWMIRTFSPAYYYGTASTPMARFYQFWCQAQGDVVGGTPQGDTVSGTFVYTRQRLATTDSTVSPQVLDMTVAAYPPNIGPGVVIPTADYRYTFIDKNLADLAKQSNYEWTIDETKTLNFKKRQMTPAPWILYSSTLVSVVDLEVDTTLIIDVANDQYRNRQVLLGVLATIPFTMTVTGNGQASSFPLPYPLCPTCPQPVFTLNGRPLAAAQKGSTGADWYYDVQLKGDPTIAQDSNGTILQSTDTMTVAGTGVYITTLVIDNVAAQKALAAIEGGTGIVEAVEDVTSRAMSVATATTYANQLLARYSVTGRTITFTTYRNGLDVGQQLAIFLPEEGIVNGQFLITEIDSTMRTQPGATSLYAYVVQATEIAYAGSWQKLLASGLLQ